MNSGEIFKDLHSSKLMIKIMDLNEITDINLILEITQNLGLNNKNLKKEILKLADYLECEPDDFYYHGGFFPLCFFKNGIKIEINSLESQVLEFMETKKRIHVSMEHFDKLLAEKKFHSLLFLIDKPFRFHFYEVMYDLIPNDQKYELFMDIYTSSEYGFGELDKNFVKDVLNYNTNYKKDKILNRIGKEQFDKNQYLTIYRGTESVDLNKAYSWTTDLNVALFFATRFSSKGDVYQAKVHLNNIKEYIYGRNEQEVIILPEDIKDIVKLELLNFETVSDEFEELTSYYHSYVIQLEKDYFYKPSNIHGMLHAKRVLLLSLMLSYYNNLSDNDIEIFAKASLFHDIGRRNDEEDPEHGRLSYFRATDLGLLEESEFDEDKIIQYVIEQHSIDDKEAINNFKQYHIKDEIRAIKLLKLFKDADALDRVRVGDLDISYLRNQHSKKLILVAYELLKNIK